MGKKTTAHCMEISSILIIHQFNNYFENNNKMIFLIIFLIKISYIKPIPTW